MESSTHHWMEDRDGAPGLIALYRRHYSARVYSDGRQRNLMVGPGRRVVLTTLFYDAASVWKLWNDPSGEKGVYCSFFRNETSIKSSVLLVEAMDFVKLRWPDQTRFYTYINPEKIQSPNPGYCYKVIGWTHHRTLQSGIHVLEYQVR